jgi:hypothetical protein
MSRLPPCVFGNGDSAGLLSLWFPFEVASMRLGGRSSSVDRDVSLPRLQRPARTVVHVDNGEVPLAEARPSRGDGRRCWHDGRPPLPPPRLLLLPLLLLLQLLLLLLVVGMKETPVTLY